MGLFWIPYKFVPAQDQSFTQHALTVRKHCTEYSISKGNTSYVTSKRTSHFLHFLKVNFTFLKPFQRETEHYSHSLNRKPNPPQSQRETAHLFFPPYLSLSLADPMNVGIQPSGLTVGRHCRLYNQLLPLLAILGFS